jgi:hypothetical protein
VLIHASTTTDGIGPCDLNVGDPIEHIRKLGGKIPDARPSMLFRF